MLGDQLTQLLLAKNGGDTGHGFRDDVRQYGLTLRKDNTKLRDQLLNNQADLDTIVKKGREVRSDVLGSGNDDSNGLRATYIGDSQGLRTADQEQELKDMQDYNQRHAVGVDDIKDFPQDGDDAEGDLKARNQPKIAGLEGIEFETGNS
ncbi:hypothetical protein EMMF5_006068 [Cystobasidiomycetes sp. EMM_F5]